MFLHVRCTVGPSLSLTSQSEAPRDIPCFECGSLSDHVYDKITFKKLGLVGVLTKEKDRVMVVWLNGITRSWIINLLIITKVESGRINSN